MLDILNGAVRASLVTFVLCGFAYPLTVTALGQWLMPFQANGSLIRGEHGAVLGSQLIGQQWDDPQWFHGRPSATTDTDPKDATKTISAPYNAASSSGSNLGPTSQALEDRLVNDWKVLDDADPDATRNALPADMLTTSGSGLDPDISAANAALQAQRVAKIRGVPPERVAALVERHVAHRDLGVLGEPR
jgi:K+-transporting ATPase ATPase C chain